MLGELIPNTVRTRDLAALMFFTACAPSEPARPARAARPRPIAVEPSLSAALLPTASATPPEVPEVPEVPALALLQACSGTHLALEWMLEERACSAPTAHRVPADPNAVATRIEPASIALAPGESMQAEVVIANKTDAPLELDLKLGCVVGGMKSEIVDGAGERADVITQCGYGSGCGGANARVTLDAQGDARFRFVVSATFVEEDAHCKAGPRRPLAPGSYRVTVHMPFGPPDASASLIVAEK